MLFPVIKGLRMEPYRAALNLEGRMLPTPWAQCPLTSGVTAPALFCCLGNILHLQHAQCSAPVGNAPKQTPPFPFPGPHIPCSWAAQGSGSAPPNQHRATYRHMGRGEELWAMGILGNVVWISCGRFKHQHTTTEFLLQQTLQIAEVQRGEEDQRQGCVPYTLCTSLFWAHPVGYSPESLNWPFTLNSPQISLGHASLVWLQTLGKGEITNKSFSVPFCCCLMRSLHQHQKQSLLWLAF